MKAKISKKYRFSHFLRCFFVSARERFAFSAMFDGDFYAVFDLF